MHGAGIIEELYVRQERLQLQHLSMPRHEAT